MVGHVINLAIFIGSGVASATVAACALIVRGHNYIVERSELTTGDEEIEAERKREREIEAQLESQKRPQKSLQHFTHNHNLVEVASGYHGGDQCGVCSQSITYGSAYRCCDCNYIIHEVCAKALVAFSPCSYSRVKEEKPCADHKIIYTFAHRKHKVKETFSNLHFDCNHCFSAGYGPRFQCLECNVKIHPVCATSPTKITSFMHPQHDLELKTRKHLSFCDICNEKEKSNLRMYRCKGCKFHVHAACSQLPQHLMHDLHSMHPLILRPAARTRTCDAICGSNCEEGRWCYECKTCNVSIHINCVLQYASHGASDNLKVKQMLQVMTYALKLVELAAPILAGA